MSSVFFFKYGVIVTVEGSGHGDWSSNPRQKGSAFHMALIPLRKGMNPAIGRIINFAHAICF